MIKSRDSFAEKSLHVPNCEQYSLFHVITGNPMKVASIRVLSSDPENRFMKVLYFFTIAGICDLSIGPLKEIDESNFLNFCVDRSHHHQEIYINQLKP